MTDAVHHPAELEVVFRWLSMIYAVMFPGYDAPPACLDVPLTARFLVAEMVAWDGANSDFYDLGLNPSPSIGVQSVGLAGVFPRGLSLSVWYPPTRSSPSRQTGKLVYASDSKSPGTIAYRRSAPSNSYWCRSPGTAGLCSLADAEHLC